MCWLIGQSYHKAYTPYICTFQAPCDINKVIALRIAYHQKSYARMIINRSRLALQGEIGRQRQNIILCTYVHNIATGN